mgnify:FL=1
MKIMGKFALYAFAVAMACGGSQLPASEAIAEEQGKMKCTACHDKAGSKLLTDQGKFYETMGTVDGYADLKGTFGRCTTCHVNKPGSTQLTKKGKKLSSVIADMDELREWLSKEHPGLEEMLAKTPDPQESEKD